LRLLFCLSTSALSGGVKVIFELANRLIDRGESVDIFSFGGSPRWFPLQASLIEARNIEAIDFGVYDYVVASNAFLVPMILPRVGKARCILLAQDYESFHHARGASFDDFISDCATFTRIYKLPIPVVSTSRAVQALLLERAGKDSYYLPLGIDKAVFSPRDRKPVSPVKRILFVGNYLMPYKGMRDGVEALRRLSSAMPVQLVMVTQERRGRGFFDDLPFPVELHLCPTEADMPDIMASCDVYCCTSWYEGFGLPAVEALSCGVPVVSTRTRGVSDYGVDGVNLLLADPASPHDLYEKLRLVLGDDALAGRLRQAGFRTMKNRFDWEVSAATFQSILQQIDGAHDNSAAVDAREMEDLLASLEREGNLTPITVYRRFQQLATRLDALTARMLRESDPTPGSIDELQQIRDGLLVYLSNTSSEYYDAFKAKYDLCQLISSLASNPRFNEYLEVVIRGRKEREHGSNSSLVEIRYSDKHARPREPDRQALHFQ
jgi:glycosyltransferase involved in cell wall biosynthesis